MRLHGAAGAACRGMGARPRPGRLRLSGRPMVRAARRRTTLKLSASAHTRPGDPDDDREVGADEARAMLERPVRFCATSTVTGCSTRGPAATPRPRRSEEHTSELQSLMRTSYAVFCLKKK